MEEVLLPVISFYEPVIQGFCSVIAKIDHSSYAGFITFIDSDHLPFQADIFHLSVQQLANPHAGSQEQTDQGIISYVIDLCQNAIFIVRLDALRQSLGLLDFNLAFKQLPVQNTIVNKKADEGIKANQPCAQRSRRHAPILFVFHKGLDVRPFYGLDIVLVMALDEFEKFDDTDMGISDGVPFAVVAELTEEISLQMIFAWDPQAGKLFDHTPAISSPSVGYGRA